MFIAGILAGPVVAILAEDFWFTSGQISMRWALLAVGVLMLAIAFVPLFPTELKAGLLIGIPLGLLFADTPRELLPVERYEESASQS